MVIERHKLPMVETKGQQRMFHCRGARALCISLIDGGMIMLFFMVHYAIRNENG